MNNETNETTDKLAASITAKQKRPVVDFMTWSANGGAGGRLKWMEDQRRATGLSEWEIKYWLAAPAQRGFMVDDLPENKRYTATYTDTKGCLVEGCGHKHKDEGNAVKCVDKLAAKYGWRGVKISGVTACLE